MEHEKADGIELEGLDGDRIAIGTDHVKADEQMSEANAQKNVKKLAKPEVEGLEKKHVGKHREPMKLDLESIEAQLGLWDTQFDLVVAKSERTGGPAQVEYVQRMDDLRSTRQVVRTELDGYMTRGNKPPEEGEPAEFFQQFRSDWDQLAAAFKELSR